MSLSDTKEKSNRAKLARLLIDGGTEVLRSILDSKHPPRTLSVAFNSHLPVLNYLKRKRVLNDSQWDKLFPPGGVAPNSLNFDITLLFILLRNICGLSPPSTGWDKLPPPTDTTLEANLARIKYFRNEVYGHISSTSIEDCKFELYWKDISSALVALGLDQNDIDSLKSEPTGTDYIKLLEEWTFQDQDLKKAVMITTEETRATRQVAEKSFEVVQQMGEKMHNFVESLRAENAEQRCSLVPSECSKLAKYEFTSHIETLCSYFFPNTRQWMLESIQHFISNEEERVTVITGRPGVGKSVIAALICQAWNEKGKLAACHFIEHGNRFRNTPKSIIESLASHFCKSIPEFEERLEEKIFRNKKEQPKNMNCDELFTLLIEEPLNVVNKPPETALLVIDALDEIDQSTKDEYVKAFFHVAPKLPKWVKLVVTTRPMPNVIPKMPHVTVIDIEKCGNNNKEDINLYILNRFQEIYLQEPKQELEGAAMTLCNISQGIFLFAHFAVEMIIEKKPKLSEIDKLVPVGISNVYEEYLNRIKKDLPIQEDIFFRFLEALVASDGCLPKNMAFEILKINELSPQEKKVGLRSLSQLFPVDGDHLTVFHKSLIDWLAGSDEGQHDFTVKVADGHRVLAPLCVQQFEVLKILENYSCTLNEYQKYALNNGFHHMLLAGGFEEQLKLYVGDLELLSLMAFANNDQVSFLFDRMNSVIKVLKLCLSHCKEFMDCLNEFKYFTNIQTVFQAAINCSEENKLRKQAVHLLGTPKYHHVPWVEFFDRGWELPKINDGQRRRIYGFSLCLDSKIAFCCGKAGRKQFFLATFNIETKMCIVYNAINEFVSNCAISSAANHPVAAVTAFDHVKLIDPQTLQTLNIIKTDSGCYVCCFLSQGAQLAVGYSDCAVRVWDVSTLNLQTTLIGHSKRINLCLPLAGNRLLTLDKSCTLLLWQSLQPDPQFVKLIESYGKRYLRVLVAISPDQTKIAAVCDEKNIYIFSADDGKVLMIVRSFCPRGVCFVTNHLLMYYQVLCFKFFRTDSGRDLDLDIARSLKHFPPAARIYRSSKANMEFVAPPFVECIKNLVGFRFHVPNALV